MRWLPLLIVLASLRAEAHPARLDEYYKPPPVCPRQANWDKFARCQLKKIKFELLHDLPAAKLVTYELDHARGLKRHELYVLTGGAWVKSSFAADTNSSTELVGFHAVTGNAYRIDLGYASSTWVTLDEVSSKPAVVRRLYTYVCTATCQSVQTSCDVLVHGKAVASFRGIPTWTGGQLRLSGVAQNTNRYCGAPAGLLPPDEVQ